MKKPQMDVPKDSAGIGPKRANHIDMTGAPGLAGRSDRDLVLAFQAGDEAAFDELYRRHHERVTRVCYRFMNNRPDAEEASQEAFLKAFQALPRFNGQFQVGAWLARIATNVCVDNLRVRSRTHLVALPSDDRSSLTEPGPEEILVGDYPEIDVAIENIQPLHAHALKMRALEGLSHIEMAGHLRMSPPQVKALLHRARSSFKKAWDKAQGWLLTPILGARSLDRSTQVSSTSNLAAISAQAPALAEKAAASVLIVMVALGAPSTFSSLPRPGTAGGSAVSEESNNTDASVKAIGSRTNKNLARNKRAVEDLAPVAGDPLAIPETLTSSIEGHNKVAVDDGGTDRPDETDDGILPPGVKEGPPEATELVEETLERLNH
jgi:RNA polymerase sigma-70 factor (ECF subfamily)